MYHVCHVSRICVCHTTILSFFGCEIVCGDPFFVLFLLAVVAVIVVIVLLCLCVMLGLCCGLVIVVAWLRLLLALLSPCGFYHVVFLNRGWSCLVSRCSKTVSSGKSEVTI